MFDADKGINPKSQHSNCMHITKEPLLFCFGFFWGFSGFGLFGGFLLLFLNFCGPDPLVLIVSLKS